MTAPALVQKRWNYCNILRDDGLSYGDYVEVRAARAFTFLLFLKMTDEEKPDISSPKNADLEAALEQFATIKEDLKP